jgi:ornithine carbamoyltransferase
MGKVGKLLDHGVEKKDITRYLAKSNYWTNETIEKAVDLVKDYNKKKKRKEASVDSNTRTASLELYETTPDFTKMSTAELITRVLFLDSVLNTSKSHNSGKEPIKDGAKAQLKAIKAAIVARGFDDEELQMLGLGLKEDA